MGALENVTALNDLTIQDPFYVKTYPWTRHSAAIFSSLSFLLGVPGNTLVGLVHVRIKYKTVSDWMIFYIALCDIFSLLIVPLYICHFESIVIPNFFCKFYYFGVNSVSMSSYFYLGLTAIERYFKVVHSKEAFSTRTARLMWLPVSFVSFGLGSLTIWTVNNNGNGHCMYNLEGRYLATLEYIFVLTTALSTSIIMTFCYTRVGIFLFLKRRALAKSGISSNSVTKNYRNTIQTTKMLAIVTAVFLFTGNAPYVSGVIFTTHEPSEEPIMTIMIVVGLSVFINNFFNPYLYMAMSARFRQNALSLFRSCCAAQLHETDDTFDKIDANDRNDVKSH